MSLCLPKNSTPKPSNPQRKKKPHALGQTLGDVLGSTYDDALGVILHGFNNNQSLAYDFLDWKEIEQNTHCSSSDVHGRGVFASRDLAKGSLVTMYPADFLVLTYQPPCSAQKCSWTMHHAYNASIKPTQHMLRTYSIHVELPSLTTKCKGFDGTIVGDPSRVVSGWNGHLVNDAASLPAAPTPMQVVEYCSSVVDTNVVPVSLSNVLLGFQATRAIAKDEEILFGYGPEYWVSKETLSSEAFVSTYGVRAKYKLAQDEMCVPGPWYSRVVAKIEEFRRSSSGSERKM